MRTDVRAPAESRNSKLPVCARPVGFTRKIRVVQPPPAANCGMICGPVLEPAERSITGKDDIRRSAGCLSLPNALTAIAETGEVAVKENVPWNESPAR